MKYFKTIVIVILLIFVTIFWFDSQSDNDEIDTLKGIVSYQLEQRDSLEQHIDSLEVGFNNKEMAANKLYKEVDSLQLLIDSSTEKPCEHQLDLYKEQNVVLKESVERCKEAKAIQSAQIKGYQDLVINYEVTCPTEIKLALSEDEKKDKKIKWLERSGWVILIILALAI